jgi:curved DNA-binding protein CbpA
MFAYILLNVTPNSSDTEIKEAYMTQSELYSPDRHPEQFKKIRKAYEKIKTQKDRDIYDVFHKDELTQADLTGLLLASKDRVNIEPNSFNQYFKESVK